MVTPSGWEAELVFGDSAMFIRKDGKVWGNEPAFIDWLIVFVALVGMFYSVSFHLVDEKRDRFFVCRKNSWKVSNFRIKWRCWSRCHIGRHVFRNGIYSRLSLAWWGLSQGIIILMLTMSGWVIYRFRSTRCLTLAQFFEKRYSRKFRIFTGIVAFTAGIINFGIFPAVGAQFFISYCGLPESFIGIPVFPLVMIILLSISLYFVYTGGQIAVIIADFFQGIFATFVLIVVVLTSSLVLDGTRSPIL